MWTAGSRRFSRTTRRNSSKRCATAAQVDLALRPVVDLEDVVREVVAVLLIVRPNAEPRDESLGRRNGAGALRLGAVLEEGVKWCANYLWNRMRFSPARFE